MPTRSKFTAEIRQQIVQALQVGASRRTAAALAGIDESQIRRWLAKGKEAHRDTMFRRFYEEVLEAEASPRMRALGIIYREMPDRPDLAWKFVERREPGYAPPMPNVGTPAQGPVIVQLAFANRAPLALEAAEVIEGEVVNEPHIEPGADPPAAS